jgi:ferredoxin
MKSQHLRMPNPLTKNAGNVPGPYYVDDTCIDCDRCRETAPASFRRRDDAGYTIVFRQPVTEAERALAEAARAECPTDSIGNDGAPTDPAPYLPTATVLRRTD